MNKEYTHITMVIDSSGSMSHGWNDVVGGYHQIVSDNKKLPGKCTFTVALFDAGYKLIEDFTDIQKVEERDLRLLGGMTALLDAIGKTITSVGAKLAALDEADRPEKVIFMVQTDGHENSSREYTKSAIQKMIAEQTAKYNWQFMFIGATLDSVAQARQYGFAEANSTTYNTNNYAATMNVLNTKLSMTRSAVTEDQLKACVSFSAEDKALLHEKVS